ncbi:MAG: glycoside hydrolase family 19 protein [Panacagrimonas sp.]
MSLVREQSTFLLQVAALINKAAELGFEVSGGELYRSSEQQALHVKNGRSKTMNSQHLKRLAVDLNFFRPKPGGGLELTCDVETLRPLGDFWEGLDAANRLGGNWSSFKDTPHFERREGRVRPGVTPEMASASDTPDRALRGKGLLGASVGAGGDNRRDDVETVQRLLNLSASKQRFEIDGAALKPDGAFGNKTLNAIRAFQRSVGGQTSPDGCIDPDRGTQRLLCEALPDVVDPVILGLAYLRASDKDIAELCPGIVKAMANRKIDSPLRQAHFLAQIGHESGELRFRAEIASGEAYEGRADLGNTQNGDGKRFKGRGLIQLTGRANYAEYGKALGREAELLKEPELVETDIHLCSDVAGWFWGKRGLNAMADDDDLTAVTRRINGGVNGLEDRRRLLSRTKSLLGV